MKTTNVKFLVVLLISLFSVKASAHEIEVKNSDGKLIYYNYINNNTELEVSYLGYSSAMYNEYYGNVVIPKSVYYNGKTYSVTRIGNYAFENCSGLTSVTIPNSVTSIGDYAFHDCSGLTSVTIPNSVTSIGWNAFWNCSGLTSITIPNSVISIGESAFYGCSGLTSVTIPNSVTSIRWGTFYGCSGLTSITVPNSVTSIGDVAFHGCSGLSNITVETGNAIYDSRNNCNAIIKTSSNELIAGCKNTVIPNSVTSIGSDAFYGCSGLTSVTIPNSVTSIGDYAFRDCSGLTSVTIPNSVTSIGMDAFYGTAWYNNQPDGLVYAGKIAYKYKGTMPSNTSIVIEEGTLGIAGSAFSRCSGLTSITIPNSVISIGDYTFWNCSGLTSVTIPNSVTSIGNRAFYGCSGLTSVTIPNSVTSIGHYAFYGCSGLTSITIPNSVTSIGTCAFYNCSGLTSVTIPNSVTSIGDQAFYGCSGLTSVTIGNSVTSIGSYAFYGCSGLTSVTIPNSVTSIGYKAFYGCSGLTSVTIPNSVTSIREEAFSECNNLKTVYSEIKSPFDINDNSFGANTYTGILYVPANTIALYKNRNGWKNFKNIKQTFALSILVSGNGSASYAGTSVRGTTSTFDVTEGTTASITFTPDDGYFLASVMVNGTNVTSSLQNGQYTISNITANTSLVVTFKEIPSTLYNLNITATGNGSASYAGTAVRGTTRKFEVYEGATAGIIFTPDEGYRIASVKVNGTDVTSGVQNGQYVINEVNDNISIEVSFVKIPSNFTDNGMNYAVTSFSGRQVMVTGGNYGIVLTVPATVTFQDETWKVAGIENGMLANNSQLAAVIWEPEAVFTAHVSNPNLLLYVKSAGYAPAGIRNVVVDGVANNIVLTDATNGNDFYCPQAFTASRISYTHNYSMTTGIGEAKGWESIALPFDVAKTVHASKGEMVPYQKWDGTDSKKPFWLMELGASGFVKANAIKANTPYIISMPNHQNYREDYRLNGSITFSAENVRVKRTDDLSQASSGDKTFVPNFTNKQGTGVYALNVNSDYVTYSGGSAAGSRFVINLRALHPFEAYMTSVSAARTPIVIGDNLVTGIDDISAMIAERAVIKVYLPSGQLVVAEKDKSLEEVKAQLPAGVYIVNGQKLIIK